MSQDVPWNDSSAKSIFGTWSRVKCEGSPYLGIDRSINTSELMILLILLSSTETMVDSRFLELTRIAYLWFHTLLPVPEGRQG